MNNRLLIKTFPGLAAIALLLLTTANVLAEETLKGSGQFAHFTPQGPLIAGMQDGANFIKTMAQHANSLNDYVLIFKIIVFKKGSTVAESGNLYFKKPQLMRIEETGPYKKGAIVVLNKAGKARGHYGGILKFISITMNPDARELRAANGYPLKDADFLSLGQFLENWLNEGIKSRVTEEPMQIAGLAEPVHVLEMYKPSQPTSVLKRIFVNPHSMLPVRWDDHDYTFPSVSFWTNVKGNQGLADDLFLL